MAPLLYGFAFSRKNISCSTLYSLKNIDNRYLLWGEASMDKYCEKLLKDQPEYILGLGIFTNRSKDKQSIRIETICSNKFRSKFIEGDQFQENSITPFLNEVPGAIYSKTIGNSWCNLISWKITQIIKSGQLKSKYTFLHLPKSLQTESTSALIALAIKNNIPIDA